MNVRITAVAKAHTGHRKRAIPNNTPPPLILRDFTVLVLLLAALRQQKIKEHPEYFRDAL